MPHAHSPSPPSPLIRLGRIGFWLAGVSAVAVAASPLVLPVFGIGEIEAINATSLCSSGDPTGLAGYSAHLISHVPLVGSLLAAGGIANAVAAGAVALGGNYLAHKASQWAGCDSAVPWGSIIRTLTLATSFLIALPAILPAITMGLTFLSQVAYFEGFIGQAAFESATSTATDVIGKLGAQGASAMAAGGAASLGSLFLSHLASCGIALGVGASAIGHSVNRATDGEHCVSEPSHDGKLKLSLLAR